MWHGESLEVILFLASMGAGSVMSAVSAAPGWPRKTLLSIGGIFAVALIAWLIAPAASPVYQAIRPIAVAVVQSGAAVILGVVGYVSLMLRKERKAAPEPSLSAASQGATAGNVILALHRARQDAAVALADSSVRNRQIRGERVLSSMRAALLTANKSCGIPLPPETDTPASDLRTGMELIDKVLPYLRQGHFEEAVKEAQMFVDALSGHRA